MEGQRARPLRPLQQRSSSSLQSARNCHRAGILIDTASGEAIAAETSRHYGTLRSPLTVNLQCICITSTTLPMPQNWAVGVTVALLLALIATNPGSKPVTLRFDRGSLKNSFEAPYLPNKLMGVKPLGKRPWNTGPGDATAVQMLRNQLDRDLPSTVVIPPRSRTVVVSTALPARGIANGLLRGRSDGRFHMAVVAAEEPNNDQDLLQVLAERRLAPGRIYLNRIRQINNGTVSLALAVSLWRPLHGPSEA